MAFNPFTWFRKHQKVFFAGLTIVCMITFVASFGAGDLIQTGLAYFGAGKSKGRVVTTLYGSKVRELDIDQLSRQRKLANDFMTSMVPYNHIRAANALDKEVPKAGLDNPFPGLREILNAYQQTNFSLARASQDPRQRRNLPMLIRFFYSPQTQENLNKVRTWSADPKYKDNPEGLQKLQTMAALLGFQAWELKRMMGARDLYFGGTRKTEDLLDFMIWKHQADKLGITLTDEDVSREINSAAGREAINPKEPFEKSEEVAQFLRVQRDRRTHAGELLNALREELRVSIAQGALLGREPGVRAYRSVLGASDNPAVFTPDEFLKYYRTQRTNLRVAMFPIPVKSFMPAVKEEPTEQELLNRFRKYADREPDPSRREPGFKQPRRIAVQYAMAAPSDPFYQDEARKSLAVLTRLYSPAPEKAKVRKKKGKKKPGKKGSAQKPDEGWVNPTVRLSGVLASGFIPPGAGLVGRLASLAAPAALDPLAPEYARYVERSHWWIAPEGEELATGPNANRLSGDPPALRPGTWLHDASTHWRLNALTTWGSFAASTMGVGGPFTAAATWYGYGTVREVTDSAHFAAALLMAQAGGVLPGPVSPLPTLATQVSLAAAFRPKVLPLKRVRRILLADLQNRLAEQRLRENMATVQKKLARFKTRTNEEAARQEAAAYLKKAAQEYHLRIGGMKEPLTKFEILDAMERKKDIGLTPLYEALRKRDPNLQPSEFVEQELFVGLGTYEPRPVAEHRSAGDPTAPRILIWRTQDLPARTLKFEQVREKVVAAWREEKARQLARRYAERLREELKGKGPAQAQRILAERKHVGEMFELNRVARLVPRRETREGVATLYDPYTVPEDRRKEFPHAPLDLVDDLMTLEKSGDVTVIADAPVRTFYLAVLVTRDEPTIRQFETLYEKSPGKDSLLNNFLEERSLEYRQKLLEQLRREAVGKAELLDKQGQFVLPEEVRRRGERTDED
jgi:hypothetical protein